MHKCRTSVLACLLMKDVAFEDDDACHWQQRISASLTNMEYLHRKQCRLYQQASNLEKLQQSCVHNKLRCIPSDWVGSALRPEDPSSNGC